MSPIQGFWPYLQIIRWQHSGAVMVVVVLVVLLVVVVVVVVTDSHDDQACDFIADPQHFRFFGDKNMAVLEKSLIAA